MKMKSVMDHSFSEVPEANIPRSVFNRSHGYKTTFDSGYLVPFYVDEALPGDTFNLKATLFARLATPIVPFMDNLHLDVFYFAVPMRLVWTNFPKFMGHQDDPGDSTDYEVPTLTAPVTTGFVAHSLSDYFGLPIGVPGITVSSLWHRGYNLIWNEWFRDENLQDSVVVDKDDGPDSVTDYVLLRRGKRHDYFTSCLPWPQKGPGVEIPLGDSAPVLGIGKYTNQTFNWGAQSVYESDHTSSSFASTAGICGDATGSNNRFVIQEDPLNSGYPNVHVDLSKASAATINSLREAFQMQVLRERDARGGTRYCEIIRSHFNVVDPMNAVLQRPEYLGGSSSPIIVTQVMQTSESGTTPQGNLAAYATVTDLGNGFTKSFTEHTLIIGLLNVRADLTYQQGIPRMFSRSTKYDFYWPGLAHLGEQSVLNKEIYAQATSVSGDAGDLANNAVFGYQERWAEYRYYPSKITGKLRSTYSPGPLDCWHLAQKFTSLPTLSDSFIVENPPIDRVVAVTDEPQFVFDSFIECRTARPMPVYSVPGLIDHF